MQQTAAGISLLPVLRIRILMVTDENNRIQIRIRNKMPRIRNTVCIKVKKQVALVLKIELLRALNAPNGATVGFKRSQGR